jgi:uncharacterized repeat protein (TIGR01451 family)
MLRYTPFAIAAGLLGGILSGCQSGPSGLFSKQSLMERRLSAAQTPLAQSKMAESARREPTNQNDPFGSSINGNPGNPANSFPPSDSNVALVSYDTPQRISDVPVGTLVGPSMQPAMRESYGVPREPMMPTLSMVDPTAPARGSPYQSASHARILRGAAMPVGSHGDGDCSCCTPGRAYRPLFPNKNAMFGLQSCGGTCQAQSGAPCQECAAECLPEVRCMDPQEYIFDGGDRDPPVRLREDLSQTGLDPEDTVVQYTTKTGVTEVQAGCRVAIYAPRFGSVRKRTGVLISDLALRPQSAMLPNGPGTLREQLPPVNVMQPLKTVSKDTVRVVEAFRDRQRPLPSELVLPMGVLSLAFKPYEDLDIIRNGDLRSTDPAKLALAAAAARIWTNIDQLEVIIDGQEAAVLSDLQQAREYTLYEYKGARVRICKVASEQIANPGDIISFTIRYDNVGEQPVSNLVVTDSLAPRLEYVDASQQSSIEARFSTTPNEAGSSVLRWEIDKELKPGEGGFVRFDAKVR